MASSRSPLWLWVKVLLCLVLIDLLLFRAGLLWRTSPDFGGVGFEGQKWSQLFEAAREFEAGPGNVPTAVLLGSSVVNVGVDVPGANQALQKERLPVRLVQLASLGTNATETAVMVSNSLRVRPWLVIYGATSRDFPKALATDTGIIRIFYDSSAELPVLPRSGAEAVLDAHAKRFWKLYRYRFFARRVVATAAGALSRQLSAWAHSAAAEEPLPPVPPEAREIFPAWVLSPQWWAGWQRWRQSGKFSDYLSWNSGKEGMMATYRAQTLASFGPDGNPNVRSLDWMLELLRQANVRTVLLFFPENPVFHDPEAKPYFDEALSRAYAELFATEAATHGARFEDLRNFLEPVDFYDMVHPNLLGQKKLTAHMADIIAQEWRARQGR
jgi:hypothetical protein